MYELLKNIKDVHVMSLPQSQGKNKILNIGKQKYQELKRVLEEKFNVKITNEKLREAIRIRNKERKILLEFYELGKLNPIPISGFELNSAVEAVKYRFDREEAYNEIEKRTLELKEKYEKELKGKKSMRPRILITGCPTVGVREKIIKQIEELGADVVAFENCSGPKEMIELVDESLDPIDGIAKKYLNINCSVMSPNPNRFRILDEMIDEYRINRVVEIILQACHTFNIESYYVKNFVTKDKHKPYISIETDYSEFDSGQLKTRINAFIEML